MRNKKPPFEITEAALSDVMEISELVGKISSTQNLSTSPILRRQNRIRTIYSSLAIEQNTLSNVAEVPLPPTSGEVARRKP